jgi:predicted nucleotidyltransferase
MSQMLSIKSEQFQKLLNFLLQKFEIRTIILFGSTARQTTDAFSDVDLLIIFDSEKIGSESEVPMELEVRDVIPEKIFSKDLPLNLSVHSTKSFVDSYKKGSLFILHILTEGIVLYDTGFLSNLSKEKFELSRFSLKEEIQLLKLRLEITEDLRKFNNYFIRCFTIFYRISRSLAFIVGALKGKPSFDRKKAFDNFVEFYPNHKELIKNLFDLRPFFLRNIKGVKVALPFKPDNIDKVIYYRNNLEEILNEVLENVDSQNY